jgi:hypothetical protein
MKRRGFLKRLAGVATAAVVSEKLIPDDGVALRSMAHPGSRAYDYDGVVQMEGFGLAPAKAEGSVMLYDELAAPDLTEASLEQACIEIKKRGGILTRAEFSEQLADGLNKAFEDVYRDYEPGGWDDDNA